MNREQRLILYSLKETTLWESLVSLIYLGFSSEARNTRRGALKVRQVFARALSDPDTVYHIEIKSPKSVISKGLTYWAILAMLLVGMAIEWRSYTGPALSEWTHTILHRCGLP